MSRKKIFKIIEAAKDSDDSVSCKNVKSLNNIFLNNINMMSKIYDIFMLIIITLSILPMCFKHQNSFLIFIDQFTAIIFIIDYFLRLLTADYKLKKHNFWIFIIYIFTPMSIIDILSILPSFTNISHSFRVLKIFRFFKTLRIFKFVRYSKNIEIILKVLKYKKDQLIAVGIMAIGYILLSALIIFQVEPSTFHNFFEAIYWSCTALTTVGFGDLYPVSMIGRIVSMISSFFGIAIVALPSGIIVSGFQDALDKT